MEDKILILTEDHFLSQGKRSTWQDRCCGGDSAGRGEQGPGKAACAASRVLILKGDRISRTCAKI